jgi:hypothetical protein
MLAASTVEAGSTRKRLMSPVVYFAQSHLLLVKGHTRFSQHHSDSLLGSGR